MNEFTALLNTAPECEALVKVYKAGQMTFNASAAALLQLNDASRVTFWVAGEDALTGTKILFVGKRSEMGYTVVPMGRRYRVRSAPLCRKVAESLQGYGTYRIEPGNPTTDHFGNTCYRIFFRNYGNK